VAFLQKNPEKRADLLQYKPYATKEEYLKKLTEDLALSIVSS
jgi:hypothetical protein